MTPRFTAIRLENGAVKIMDKGKTMFNPSNMPLAKWAARTGYSLIGHRSNDNAAYRITVYDANAMVFNIWRDNEFCRTIRLQTSGTLTERELYTPGVALDRDWFAEFELEPVLPNVLYA